MENFESEKGLDFGTLETYASMCISSVKRDISDSGLDLVINNLNNLRQKDILTCLAKASSIENPTLMYGTAVLVSSNVNLNDDAFLPEEVWAARKTPLNTPYNNNHKRKDIIGHIYNSVAVSAKGKAFAETETKVPDYLDLNVDFVIYEMIFPQVAESIYEGAAAGKKFVSMECRFAGFDYGMLDKNGQIETIIARNKETSFLTKHLRVYGGTGSYEGKRVVRVLRDINFIGMGSVDNPANPDSEYKKIDNITLSNCNNIEDSKIFVYTTEGSIMKIDNLDKALEIIEDLKAKVVSFEKEKTESKASEKITALEAEKIELTQNLETEKTKSNLASTELTKANEKYAELEKNLKAVEADLKTKSDQLDKINTEAKVSNRLAKVTELGIELNDEVKASISTMTDDAFASVLTFVKPFAKKTEDASAGQNKTDAEKVLEDAKEKKETDVTKADVGDVSTELEALAARANKLGEALMSGRKNVKNTKK